MKGPNIKVVTLPKKTYSEVQLSPEVPIEVIATNNT